MGDEEQGQPVTIIELALWDTSYVDYQGSAAIRLRGSDNIDEWVTARYPKQHQDLK